MTLACVIALIYFNQLHCYSLGKISCNSIPVLVLTSCFNILIDHDNISICLAAQSLFLPVKFSYSIDSTLVGSALFYSSKLFLCSIIKRLLPQSCQPSYHALSFQLYEPLPPTILISYDYVHRTCIHYAQTPQQTSCLSNNIISKVLFSNVCKWPAFIYVCI